MKGILLGLAAALWSAPALAQTTEAPSPVDYSNADNWLCLPGRADACGVPLPTTALNPNGYGSNGLGRAAADAPVDCFYVYPTVSQDASFNSDMEAGVEEKAAAAIQFARFAGVCRPFAPVYRQMTLAGLAAAFAGQPRVGDPELAYGDVRDAWRTYLREHNDGRPFVLVGHSQGTIHLARLLAEEIEGEEFADRMLSALLIGYNIVVPEGAAVGGTFQRTPLCTEAGQTGCVVTYVSFRANNPPPEGAWFGRAARPGMTIACTNPAALGRSASAPLDSYWFTAAPPMPGAPAIAWSGEGDPPTPFLRTEGLVSAACVNRGPVGYLSVRTDADPGDARTDTIPGDVYVMGKLQPGWGLHLADMSIAQGDLIRIVEEQARSWQARR